MITRKNKIETIIEDLDKKHPNNIIRTLGTGSFFHSNLDVEYKNGLERPIDLHIIIKDLDEFYKKHKISDTELQEFNIDKNDLTSIENTIEKFKKTNEIIPMYHLNKDKGYRITVIPFSKLNEWISKNSKIGYFLTGRWQKPLKILYQNSSIEEEIFLDNVIFPRAYNIGLKKTLDTLSGIHTFDSIITHLYKLSYISEGIRGLEGILRKKPKKIFNEMNSESHEIYDSLILNYILENKDPIELNNKGKWDLVKTHTSKKDSKQNLQKFKEFNTPRYARVLWYLDQSFPDPDDFATRKILRSIGLNDKKKFNQKIISSLLKPLRNYMYNQLRQLPEELQPKEFIEKYN